MLKANQQARANLGQSVDGEALVVHVVAPSLRDLQAVLDATLAALNEAESAG